MRMSEEDLRQEDIRNARFSQQEQMDLLREYVELRLLLDDPCATMKVYVLEPVCEYCRFWPAEAPLLFSVQRPTTSGDQRPNNSTARYRTVNKKLP